MNEKDLLTIKTGELLAKTDELREISESLHLLTKEIKKKTEEIRIQKKGLKEIEIDLIEANDQLTETNEKFALTNKELAQVNKDLVEANQQIKQLLLKQRELLDITGHELRTPIQALYGNFELIERDIPSLLQNPSKGNDNINREFESLVQDKPRLEQFTNRLVSAYRNSQRLEKLVTGILDISKIDNNRLRLNKESFNLNEKIQNVIKDVLTKTNLGLLSANSLPPINIVFKPHDDPIIVFADKIRIFEVLSNLLNNAIKFSNGESITVSTTKGQNKGSIANDVNFENPKDGKSNIEKIRDNELVIVSIRDKGKGIDEEILPRLFNKFVTKSNQGTGLGLYIAKSIVEAHGGDIWAHNNKDEKGANFSFSLPLHT
ncbi:ATP-binding protein [Candidatus Nitrosocosmicus sp. FF01]|uniref:ATP-binding protein n=1 Tax=Candidatus Nitrosocosmicus sp. FF01 TaxID=3397670 RepID=UPI0039EADA99